MRPSIYGLRKRWRHFKESDMNDDIIKGNWKQFTGKVKENWGKLTNDVFDIADGNTEYLSGKLQEQYGWDRERADKEIKKFEKTIEND